MQSYVAVEGGAHRVGRALHAIGEEWLTATVAIEAQAELTAIERPD